MAQDNRLAALCDKEEIRDLLYTYCRGVDRIDADLLRAVFHEDATVTYGGFKGAASEWVGHATRFLNTIGPTHHNLTNILITLDGDKAKGETYCIAVHGDVQRDEGLVDLVVYVRYVDEFERRNGAWRISKRTLVYDWNQNLPRTVRWEGPASQPSQYFPRGVRGPGDPSYR